MLKRVPVSLLTVVALLGWRASPGQVAPSADPIVRPAFDDIVGRLPSDAPKPSNDPRDFNGTYLAQRAGAPEVTPAGTAVGAPPRAAGEEYVPGPAQMCIPVPTIGGGPADIRAVIQTSKLIIFFHEDNHLVTRVYLERNFPATLEPSYLGYSIGHWEGDALVIETRGLKTADLGGRQMTHVTRVVDRVTKSADGALHHAATVQGETADGREISLQRDETDVWRPDLRPVEFSCEDGSELFFDMDGVKK
jgi:hypothetical protein